MPFPGLKKFGVNGRVFDVNETVRNLQSNGYKKQKVDRYAYIYSRIRCDSGLPPDDKENWSDAELYYALTDLGVVIDIKDVMFRRKVLLPSERSSNHFKKYSVSNVYLSSKISGLIGPPRFIEATVTHVKDNSVYFITRREWHDEQSYWQGRKGVASLDEPDILLRGEYDFLTNNPEQLDIWLTDVSKSANGDFEEFESAFNKMCCK